MTDISVAARSCDQLRGHRRGLRGGPGGEPMTVTFDDLTLTNSYGAACVRFVSTLTAQRP